MIKMIKKTTKRKMRKLSLCTIYLVIIILSFNNVFALTPTPTPRGIEGKIYHLDAITEVFSGFPVIIENLNTSEIVEGKTGKGSSGRYSFVLNWDLGDEIKVIARNPFFEDSVTLELEGSIRNVNLYLNMTFENLPPNITSIPVIEAITNYEYLYQVTSFDWNGDIITYSLAESPENMTINEVTGLVSWTPTREQFGTHSVIINASDDESYTLQVFNLEVFTDKNAPLIVSEPIRNIMRNEKYEYEVLVDDEELELEFLTFNVFRGPEGMHFVNNTLTFEMNNSHSGEYIVIIDVTDRFDLVARQIFILRIDEPQTSSRSRPIDARDLEKEKEATIKDIYERIQSIKEFLFEKGPIKKIFINNNDDLIEIKIREINPLLEKIKTTNTRSYAYLKIESNEEITSDVDIYFSVLNNWLEKNAISSNDIVLLKYQNNSWVELETSLLETATNNTNDVSSYKAISPGLSYFAISHKDTYREFPRDFDVNVIEPVFLILGNIIVEKDTPLSDDELQEIINNIDLKFINVRTGNIEGASIIALNNNNNNNNKNNNNNDKNIRFSTSVTGRLGDEVLLSLKINNFELNETIFLSNAVQEHNIYLNYELIGFNKQENKLSIIILFVSLILVLLIIIHVFLKIKKGRKNKNTKQEKRKKNENN